jgi:hypothetical protein
MSDIVVTPCHSRPEYLKVWMELVKKAKGASEFLYVFCLDSGFDPKYEDLIYEFPFECSVIKMHPEPLGLGKQSRNVLNGLIAAAQNTDKFVYYVEEDIFIGVDFFRWHQEIQFQQRELFCSIATKSNNTQYTVDGFANHYYVTKEPDYQALGNCFRKEIILDLIAPHYNDSYLQYPTSYCTRNWPKSIIGSIWTEQDGLIRRILEQSKMSVAYPCLPFAFHSGFYGYNRHPHIMRKKYEDKLKLVREVCFDKVKMREYLEPLGESYWKDSVPCELDLTFDTLIRVDVNKIM